MSKVTTYQDLLDNDHAALVAESAERYPAHAKLSPKVKHMRRPIPRSEAARLREYEAQLWGTSINLLDVRANPFL